MVAAGDVNEMPACRITLNKKAPFFHSSLPPSPDTLQELLFLSANMHSGIFDGLMNEFL
jgi:hypothetical protein